jgi:hypothetical protein
MMDYVVAVPWADKYPGTQGLCIYTYGRDIQRGDQDSAEHFLEYVKSTSKDDWAIYKVEFTKL